MNQVLIKIISDSDNQTPNPNASEGGNANGKPDPRAKNTKKKKSDSQVMAIYFARKAYYLVKGQATQYATKYFNASEMYKEKIMVDNAMSIIDFGVDLFSAGITGAKYGGGVGFAIGTAFAALVKGVQRFNELSNETQKLIDSSYGNYFNATRAGFVAGGHNTEN